MLEDLVLQTWENPTLKSIWKLPSCCFSHRKQCEEGNEATAEGADWATISCSDLPSAALPLDAAFLSPAASPLWPSPANISEWDRSKASCGGTGSRGISHRNRCLQDGVASYITTRGASNLIVLWWLWYRFVIVNRDILFTYLLESIYKMHTAQYLESSVLNNTEFWLMLFPLKLVKTSKQC